MLNPKPRARCPAPVMLRFYTTSFLLSGRCRGSEGPQVCVLSSVVHGPYARSAGPSLCCAAVRLVAISLSLSLFLSLSLSLSLYEYLCVWLELRCLLARCAHAQHAHPTHGCECARSFTPRLTLRLICCCVFFVAARF